MNEQAQANPPSAYQRKDSAADEMDKVLWPAYVMAILLFYAGCLVLFGAIGVVVSWLL